MSDTIIVALVSLVGSLIGGYMSHSKVVYRVDQLEKKVDKHNQVIERTYALEERAALMEEKMKVANHRIEDLEEK